MLIEALACNMGWCKTDLWRVHVAGDVLEMPSNTGRGVVKIIPVGGSV